MIFISTALTLLYIVCLLQMLGYVVTALPIFDELRQILLTVVVLDMQGGLFAGGCDHSSDLGRHRGVRFMLQVELTLFITRVKLDFLLIAYWRQEVLNNIILPVADLAITFDLLCLIVAIVNIKPSIMGEVSEGNLVEPFEEHMVCSLIITNKSLVRVSVTAEKGLLFRGGIHSEILLAGSSDIRFDSLTSTISFILHFPWIAWRW